MSIWFDKRHFDLTKFSVTLITPIPIDVTSGLAFSETESFVEIKKANEESKLVNYKVGLGGETLFSENIEDFSILELTYLPSSPTIPTLDALKLLRTQFGVLIQNNSAPRYKGIASECRFIEKPTIKVGRTDGFGNFTYKILMTDYV